MALAAEETPLRSRLFAEVVFLSEACDCEFALVLLILLLLIALAA